MEDLLSKLNPDELITLRLVVKTMYDSPRPSLNKLRDLVYDEIDNRLLSLQTNLKISTDEENTPI